MFLYGIFFGFFLALLILFAFFYFFILQDGDGDTKPIFNVDFNSKKIETNEKSGFNLKTGNPESCEWFNFLAQRIFDEYMNCKEWKEKILLKIKEVINSGKLPSFVVRNIKNLFFL